MINFTNKAYISEKLNTLIDNEKEIAIALSGEWGIGKTYFWNEFMQSKQDKKFAYISLFNCNSIEEIETSIIMQISKISKNISQIRKYLNNIKSTFKSEQYNINIPINLLFSLFEKKNFEKIIICFDDFERLSDKLSLKDVLGLISQLKEQKKCKIIMILNEKELDKLEDIDGNKQSQILSLYKEKIIDYEFPFIPNINECFDVVKDEIIFFDKNKILEYFQEKNIKNIRVMKQCINNLNRFSFIEKHTINEKIVDKFLNISLELFTFKIICGFSKEKYNEFKEYKDNKKLNQVLKKEENLDSENKEFKRCINYHKDISYNWEQLETVLFNYIYKLDFNESTLIEFLKNDRRLNFELLKEEIEKLEKDYLYNLKKTKDNFIEELRSILIRDKNLLAMFDLEQFKEYMDYFEDGNFKNDLLESYIKKQLDTQDKEYIDKRDDINKFLEQFPKMKIYVKEYRAKYSLGKTNLEDFLKQLGKQQKYISTEQKIILTKEKENIKNKMQTSNKLFQEVVKLILNNNKEITIINNIIIDLANENQEYKYKFEKLDIL